MNENGLITHGTDILDQASGYEQKEKMCFADIVAEFPIQIQR